MAVKKTPAAYEKKIQLPYHIHRSESGVFFLLKRNDKTNRNKIVKELLAQSADGADREAALHLGMGKYNGFAK